MKEPRMFQLRITRDAEAEASKRWRAEASTEDRTERRRYWAPSVAGLADQLVDEFRVEGFAVGYLARLAAGEFTEAEFLAPELVPVQCGAVAPRGGVVCCLPTYHDGPHTDGGAIWPAAPREGGPANG